MNRPPRYPRARLSPAKDDRVVLLIDRENVETNHVTPLLEQLRALSSTREAALQWEGTLTFAFDGWDDDPRETAQIPEIRAYFAKLTEAWPYWLHFGEKIGDTIHHVLRLLCSGHYIAIDRGLVAWEFDDLHEVKNRLLWLFTGMNGMYDRLGLPEEINERITEEVVQLIACSLQ
jgi:hypothetical protein